MNNKEALFERAYAIIGERTPITGNCGELCGAGCCKGDEKTGMRLFPGEEAALDMTSYETTDGTAICSGRCERENRPLACRIFPFLPVFTKGGRITVAPDAGAYKICPLLQNIDMLRFNKDFLRSVRKVGRFLSSDPDCRKYLSEISRENEKLSALIFNNKNKSLIRK